jgi:hypothetical protein
MNDNTCCITFRLLLCRLLCNFIDILYMLECSSYSRKAFIEELAMSNDGDEQEGRGNL